MEECAVIIVSRAWQSRAKGRRRQSAVVYLWTQRSVGWPSVLRRRPRFVRRQFHAQRADVLGERRCEGRQHLQGRRRLRRSRCSAGVHAEDAQGGADAAVGLTISGTVISRSPYKIGRRCSAALRKDEASWTHITTGNRRHAA